MIRELKAIILLCFPGIISAIFFDGNSTIDKNVTWTKCYGSLGCISNGWPFYDKDAREVTQLPESRQKVNTTFFLFTQSNRVDGTLIRANSSLELCNSFFDGTKKTIFIVEGFRHHSRRIGWAYDMKNALLEFEDVNVFQVYWVEGAHQVLYSKAAANTRLVGDEIAIFIEFLEEVASAKRTNMHIIGHSLGAHAAGYAGNRLQGRLGRISGLDPAKPYFENAHTDVRLDQSDAIFVDAVHTDGSGRGPNVGGFGINHPVGHIDFYPNGGTKQRGCSRNVLKRVYYRGIRGGLLNLLKCDHLRAGVLYVESITASKCPFLAYPCDSYHNFTKGNCISCGQTGCARMGYHADKWTRPNGITGYVKMYLDTKGEKDFCRFHAVLKVFTGNSVSRDKLKGKMYIAFYTSTGKSPEIKLRSSTNIKQLSEYKFLLKLKEKYGQIHRILFRWKTSFRYLVNRVTRKRKFISIKKIEVTFGIDASQFTFCGDGGKVKDNVPLTLNAANAGSC